MLDEAMLAGISLWNQGELHYKVYFQVLFQAEWGRKIRPLSFIDLGFYVMLVGAIKVADAVHKVCDHSIVRGSVNGHLGRAGPTSSLILPIRLWGFRL